MTLSFPPLSVCMCVCTRVSDRSPFSLCSLLFLFFAVFSLSLERKTLTHTLLSSQDAIRLSLSLSLSSCPAHPLKTQSAPPHIFTAIELQSTAHCKIESELFEPTANLALGNCQKEIGQSDKACTANGCRMQAQVRQMCEVEI